tara:strand:- start:162 stop:1133 length:972 start_codon:yes stop_codon:yes gene_type:complete
MNDFYNLKVKINKAQSSIRLDKALTKLINNFSRSQIKILIEAGKVKQNNKKIYDSAYLVKEGEYFEISTIVTKPKKHKAEDLKLEVVYEDEDLLIVNKKAGMVTHPAPGNQSGTLVNALLHYTNSNLSNINDLSRPGIVHRLDKNTSGLLVVAKNNSTHLSLSQQFKSHNILRKYNALVWGTPSNQIVQGYIQRHRINRKKMSLNKKEEGKFSKTELVLKKNFEIASLVECTLHTGRTHQVRLHLTSINNPIVGDQIYGKSKVNQFGKNKDTFNKFLILKNFDRQALHASTLGFIHPNKKKFMKFNSKLPEDIANLLDLLVKY